MPIYKTKTDVVGGDLRGSCSCGWKGTIFLQSLGLSDAMHNAQRETKDHEHIPAASKPRKNSKKAPAIKGVA